jgi:hypothetical protein
MYACMYVHIWMVEWMDGCSTTIKHSIYQSIYLSIHPSIYLFIYLLVRHDCSSQHSMPPLQPQTYHLYPTTHFFLSSNYCYNYYFYFYCCICGLLQSLTGHGLSIQGTTLPKIEILAELDILHSIAQKP